jgi:hypothetical protein
LVFVVKFNKADTVFTAKQRLIHNLFIWIIPFLWILLLKSMCKPTLGSHQYKTKQKTGKFYESWLGFWGDTTGSGHDHGGSDSNEYI